MNDSGGPACFGQSTLGLFTFRVDLKGQLQPSNPLLAFAISQEDLPSLAAQGDIVRMGHDVLSNLVEPPKIGLNLIHALLPRRRPDGRASGGS